MLHVLVSSVKRSGAVHVELAPFPAKVCFKATKIGLAKLKLCTPEYAGPEPARAVQPRSVGCCPD